MTINSEMTNSELNRLIPPEIKNDEFYAAIQKLAREEDITTVLEIGSSCGGGSTEAFVTGLRHNPNKPTLFCMEVSQTRFVELKKKYENDSFVKCYNVSSVPLEQFPNKNEVIDFYNSTQTNLNLYPLEQVLGWLQQDIEYVINSGVSANGIKKIKHENHLELFGLVLIDGSEFTGSAELDDVYGSKIICLDDINTFKNYKNHQKLLADKNYFLIVQNTSLRNGYSIFKKNDKIENYFSVYETSEQLLVSKIVKPGMLVFDIGANVGDYSLLLSKLVGNHGKIYSFEAASSTFDKLQERMDKRKCSNVYPVKKAVYSHNTQIEFNEFPENYSAPSLPINFFTIVLNGEPFIRYHIEVFKQLPFKWHWHIVEGVADLKNDTAWSIELGGRISDDIHHNGLSTDGTTEYLDELTQLYPDNITIYRKPEGVFWEGKREMVNAPLLNIQEECLLWQVDVDELWTVEQICIARQMFINNPDKTAAFYWCWYFVGENLIISTRNCYAQNPQQEWLRTWRFKPGAFWAAHEPPMLVEPSLPDGKLNNVGAINPFMHGETKELGLIFQHFAYVTKEQLQFKEKYYGYTNAVSQWLDLQEQTKFPLLLSQYFSWVQDNTKVDIANAHGIVPIAQREFDGNWRFLQSEDVQKETLKINNPSPIIIIDGVFFQLYKTGIARVWKSLLEEWADNGFTKHIIVINRAGTAPKIAGIKYRTLPHYDYSDTNTDREILQQVCDEEGADLFISTYYTTPTATPSVFLAHDMIPELFGWNLNHPMWQEKHYGIQHASAYIAVSENTARDLVKCFPDISLESVIIAKNGVNHQIFYPAQPEELNAFKSKYGITKPYFILVGAGSGYKNSILFFQAFYQLASSYGFDIVSTGIGGLADLDFRAYTSGSIVHILQLSDEELKIAYSGGVALIYPSKYEGFGLPVLEAIACGCPVITSPNASIPEVAGKAALYVQDDDIEGMANALCEVQKPSVRKSLITAGLEQAKKFSWSNMAKVVSSTLIDTTLEPLNLREINLIVFPDWLQPEELLGLELQRVISAIATHPASDRTTLLIDTTNIYPEDAELLLSGVTMNLLMEEDLDVSEGLEISLISNLADIQWKALLSRLTARIILESENKQALAQVKAQNLSSYNLNSFIELALHSTIRFS